jgi:hypothetical protein
MLKYLLITGTTVIINLSLIATDNIRIVNAATVSTILPSPVSQDKLITKEEKPVQINARQQSDVKSIRQVLTQYYRGFNQHSIEKIERTIVPGSVTEQGYLRDFFSQIKSNRVDVSIEVQNIELVSLSANNALVKIDQVMKANGSQRTMTSQQSASVALVRYRGQWKISDSNTAIKAIDRYR